MMAGSSAQRVVAARLISSTGAEAAFVLGLWGKAAFVLEGTPTDLAIMSALIGVAAMAGSVLGGVAVDRFDARRVVLAAEVAFVPATLALILADDLTSLFALAAVSWLLGAVLETAIVSLPPVLVAPERLEATNARLESANSLALIVGPAVGALLITAFGLDAVFVFDAATSVVALALVAALHLPAVAPSPVDDDGETPGPVAGLRSALAGLGYAWRSGPIRTALYLAALPALAFGVFIALEPLFFRDIVGTEVETLGYVNAVYGLGLLVGSLALHRAGARAGRFRVLAILTVWSGLGGMLYVASPALPVIVVGALVWSIPVGALFPLARTLAQRFTPATHVGRVMGALGLVISGLPILPVVVAPALAAAFGLQAVLIGSSALAVLGVPFVWSAVVRLDRSGPTPTPTPAADVEVP
ncbi:MAG: MFS transporter [Acidimicrobiales bacterium]